MRAQGIPESTARVEVMVQFSHGPKGARKASEQPDPARPKDSAALLSKAPSTSSVPKITRLLVLGHHFEWLVREGKVKDYAEIARLTVLTRARVTQIVNLTLLASGIQEQLLFHQERSQIPNAPLEPHLRAIVASPAWETVPAAACEPCHSEWPRMISAILLGRSLTGTTS